MPGNLAEMTVFLELSLMQRQNIQVVTSSPAVPQLHVGTSSFSGSVSSSMQ